MVLGTISSTIEAWIGTNMFRLNLTSASRVYMMEPHYNPAAEAQAVDRIHRLGQKRPVKCVRFIMKDSFELKILDLQKKKTELANLTFSQGKKLTKEQMSKQKLEVSTKRGGILICEMLTVVVGVEELVQVISGALYSCLFSFLVRRS